MMFDVERRKLEEEAGEDRFLCMMARQTIELMEERGSAGLVMEEGKTLAGLKKIFDKFAGENRKGKQAVIMPDEAAEMICDYKKLGGIMGILLGVNKGMLKLTKAFGFFTKGNIIILALTAIALAIGYIYQNWDKIKKTKFGKALIKIGNVLKQVGGVLKKVGLLVLKSFVLRFKLMVLIVRKAWNVLKKIGSFLSGKFKKAVEKVSDPVTALKDAWAGIKNKTVELKGKIADGLENLGDSIADKTAEITIGLKDDFSNAWGKVKDAWEGVKNKTAELWSSLKDTFSSAWDKVKGAWEGVKNKTAELWSSLKDTFSSAWDKVKGTWESVKNKTAELWTSLKDTFSNAWGEIKESWNSITGKSAELWASMKDTFSSVWSGVKSKWSEAKDALKDKTATLKAELSDAFSNKLNGFKSSWNSAKDDIKGKTATLKAELSDKFSKEISSFKKKWNAAKKKITGKTAEIKMKFTDKLKNGWNALAKKVNGARKKNALAKKLLPAMPYLAQGAWVSKNTPQLAVVGDNRHENEIVAPDSKLETMARQAAREAGGGSDAQLIALLTRILTAIMEKDTNVYLDGEMMKNNVVRRINQHTKATGRLEIIL